MEGYRSNLDYSVSTRQKSDSFLDPAMSIILTIVTCGIYGYYVFYKLVERRDEHFKRMFYFVDSTIALLYQKASEKGKAEELQPYIARMEYIKQQMTFMATEKNPTLWLVIAFFTGGIGMWIMYYFLMDEFPQHEALEYEFFTLTSQAFTIIGLAPEASQALPITPKREFVMFLLLTFVTCGIYGIYWMYVMILDPNNHFENQIQWENYIYSVLTA